MTDPDDEDFGHAEIINGAIVCVKGDEKLTDEEREVIAEYIEFCRARAAKRRRGTEQQSAIKPSRKN
jgi:hypothetical protein